MLGMLYVNGPNPLGPNAWKMWIDHVTKQKESLGLTKATLVYNQNGNTAAASPGFFLTPKEVKKIKMSFPEANNNGPAEAEKFSIKDKTYVIKAASANQLVAFNGSRYIIVSRSKTMLLVVLCESRSKCGEAAVWVSRLSAKLVERNF